MVVKGGKEIPQKIEQKEEENQSNQKPGIF